MTRLPSLLTSVFVVLMLAAACSSDPVASDPVTPVPATETATVESEVDEATPAPEPPVVSDDDRITAAVAQLEADLAAGDGPEGMIAADVIATKAGDDGRVTLNVCGWNGDTVFDQVRDSLYDVVVADDGTITANHVGSPIAVGECVNSALIETALEALETFDAHWGAAILNPETFADDPQRLEIYSESGLPKFELLTRQWAEDGLTVRGDSFGTGFGELEADFAWRRFLDDEGRQTLEVAYCRSMDPTYGLYKGDLLLDDDKAGTIEGPHSVDAVRLVRVEGSPARWVIDSNDTQGWADCFLSGEFIDGMTAWKPEPSPWQNWESPS